MMTTFELMALVGAGVAVLVCASLAARKSVAPGEGAMVLAAFGVAFFLYTLVPLVQLGLPALLSSAASNSWSLQVWLDLLMAISAGFFLLQPRAKAVGVTLWPWVVLILMSGSIGLFAAIIRVLVAERASGQRASA